MTKLRNNVIGLLAIAGFVLLGCIKETCWPGGNPPVSMCSPAFFGFIAGAFAALAFVLILVRTHHEN